MRKKRLNLNFFALIAVMLAAGSVMPAEAQINTRLRTAGGRGWLAEVSKWGGYINIQVSRTCDPNNLEGCIIAMDSTLIPGWMPNIYSGNANAQKLSVSGHIHGMYGNGDINGGASSNFTTNLYADVPAGANLKVTVGGDLHLDWNSVLGGGWSYFGFTSPVESTSSVVGYNPILLSATFNERKVLSAKSRAEANAYIEEGGKRYHYIGQFYSSGETRLDGSGSGSSAAGYSSVIDNISVRYTGKVLTVNDGDNQTWLTGQPLPKDLSVKVADSETGVLASSVPITFTLLAPINGARFSNNQTSIVANTAAGIAAVKLTLGASTGTYKVKATCPDNVCVPDAREVAFTATAVGNELTCVSCEWHGAAGRELPTPFRLRVLNALTGLPVSGAAVTYSIIRFTDRDGNTRAIPNGTALRPPTGTITDIYGFSRAYLTLGSEEGTYVVRARCEGCLNGQEQVARGIAHEYEITPEVEQVVTADPDPGPGPSDECPSGCCPLTPVLRITRITRPNANISFTSDAAENLIGLRGKLLPECLGQNSITWQVADAPGDYINSGTPATPTPGDVSSFRVSHTILPVEPTGSRARPLAYKVTAGVGYNGTMLYANATVKQDEIDKCRQEYFDVSLSTKDLRVGPYFNRYLRNMFTLGVDGKYVKYRDCYAHIYPQAGAIEVERLKGKGFLFNIQSGYRSARHNKLEGGVWNSEHMFGDAVDIQAATVNGQTMKPLWLEAECPKILETMVDVVVDGKIKKQFQAVLTGTCDGAGSKDWQGTLVEGFLSEKYFVDENDDGVYDVLQDSAPTNGITDVFDIARVIHLGR